MARPPNFYIAESLIKARSELFYNVRKLKKEKNLNYSAYSFHGDIFIRFNINERPTKIIDISDVVNACLDRGIVLSN